ncbi:MAG: FHA domain-containing protein [Coriobacteriaceae bacterium]|nr:FHA domain-containing protein [Coriobacteriaceae bacterium]
MKAVNEMKPINVLARFIASWVNERLDRGDALPFDSFETLRAARIEQKDVERWVLNCNYVYYRVGNMLLEGDLLPGNEDELCGVLQSLDQRLKSIRDSNPLNLRSKQPEAIVDELGKDWPPFAPKSRNSNKKTAGALSAFLQDCNAAVPGLPGALRATVEELQQEKAWYQQISAGEASIAERCRTLLPLWCAHEINPLFSLLMWQDEQAVLELAEQLSQSFAANGYPSFDGGSRHDAYMGIVCMAQGLYLDGLARAGTATVSDMRAIPLPQLAGMLERGGFGLDRPCDIPGIPAWLAGKSLLIWNVAMCSVLGPREAIRPLGLNRTCTTLEASAPVRNLRATRGEVLLRRCLMNGERELVDTLDLDEACPDGTVELAAGTDACVGAAADAREGHAEQDIRLWHVLGSSFDEQARVPKQLEAAQTNLARVFLPTARLDNHGRQLEGMGDSRFHAMLYLTRGPQGWRLHLRDLGSKNGTFVRRATPAGTDYYLLVSRHTPDALAWGEHTGVAPEHVRVVDTLELEREDVIQLCGSRFELL